MAVASFHHIPFFGQVCCPRTSAPFVSFTLQRKLLNDAGLKKQCSMNGQSGKVFSAFGFFFLLYLNLALACFVKHSARSTNIVT